MNPLLSELRRDHGDFSRALHLLEKQCVLLQRGEAADLHVLSELVDYVQNYPELDHHPREELIIAVYLERSERGVNLIERLGREHRLLREQSEDIKDQLEQWECDSPVPREQIAVCLGHYLRSQWRHLSLEEDSIYALWSRHLTADDWERIGASLPAAPDPRFGPLSLERGATLLERMAELET